MAYFAYLLVFATVMVAFGGDSRSDGQENCTSAHIHGSLVCATLAQQFSEKIDNFTLRDQNEIKSLNDSCEQISTCSKRYEHCVPFQLGRINTVSETVKSSCSLLQFLMDKFSDCKTKLENEQSECFLNWNPLKNIKDLYNKKKKINTACYNFFSKDACLEKEITKTCSKEEWLGLKNKMQDSAVEKCDFNGIV